jgi:hypothetical protein
MKEYLSSIGITREDQEDPEKVAPDFVFHNGTVGALREFAKSLTKSELREQMKKFFPASGHRVKVVSYLQL